MPLQLATSVRRRTVSRRSSARTRCREWDLRAPNGIHAKLCGHGPRAEADAARRLPRMTFGEPSRELQPPRRHRVCDKAAGSAGGPKPGRASFSVKLGGGPEHLLCYLFADCATALSTSAAGKEGGLPKSAVFGENASISVGNVVSCAGSDRRVIISMASAQAS